MNKHYLTCVALILVGVGAGVTAYMVKNQAGEPLLVPVAVAQDTDVDPTDGFKTFDEYLDAQFPESIQEVAAEPLTPKPEALTPTSLLADRMADGLIKYFGRKDGWADCGVIHRTTEEIAARATVYAYTIVLAANEQSDDDFELNPWGLLGVMLQESGLDPCAVGKNPRETAYRLEILKRPRVGLTHKKEKLIEVLTHPMMKRLYAVSGYDLGLGQMLQPFYDHPNDFERIFNPVYAANQAAKEMVRRARRRDTDEPWKYWRGHLSEKYANRVLRQARRAGAKSDDI